MSRRCAMSYGLIATLVAAGASGAIGAAHAQGDDGGFKGGFKQGVSQAVDPSNEVNEAFDNAKDQICGNDPHSLACTVAVILGIGVPAMLAIQTVTRIG